MPLKFVNDYWLPGLDWLAFGQSLRACASRIPSPLLPGSVEPWFSSSPVNQIAVQFGCPAWAKPRTSEANLAFSEREYLGDCKDQSKSTGTELA